MVIMLRRRSNKTDVTDAITGTGKLRFFFSHVSILHKSRFPSKLALSKILSDVTENQ
jgi:hypothetical protein